MAAHPNGEKSMANRARDWFAQAEKDVALARLAQANGSHEWAAAAGSSVADPADCHWNPGPSSA